MNGRVVLVLVGLVFSGSAALAQSSGQVYKIEKDRVQVDGQARDRVFVVRKPDKDGNPTLYVTVQFKITRPDGKLADDVNPSEIVVTEDGRPVTNLEIHAPASLAALTTMLAMDTSGSMAEHGKMDEARRAARLFLDALHAKADAGLILFDHKLRFQERPRTDRRALRDAIESTQPRGGTAYLDAAVEAVNMLRGAKGRRAVLLMTDGIDLNSEHKVADVVALARKQEVPLYTIGVGEPGKNTPVTSVLVLDKSGSMDEPADDTDRISKMEALHRAASRFVDIMRTGARTTLLPFSDEVDTPQPFTGDKEVLKQSIAGLEPGGQTALFDATYEAVSTLVAARPDGKRAVVVLTDGKDNRSRRRKRDVIARAKAAEVPIHMIGLGRRGELNERDMKDIAEATGGTYQHAANEARLFEIFENLSIQLHDEGIDEVTLKKLAAETGGKYFLAQDISQLRFIYEGLAHELQDTYTVTFPSLRQEDDGTIRDIKISVLRNGQLVSNELGAAYRRQNVVVPEMDAGVYLGLLAVMGGLIFLPVGLRRFTRSTSA